MSNSKNSKILILGTLAAVMIIALDMTVGINDAGQRTVVQYPSGTLFVKFSPGVYFKWFGNAEEYNDVLTFDFSTSEDNTASINTNGIPVRYQDGGTGTIHGKARFSLPTDRETMIALHKAFRSNEGVANKLITPIAEEGMNLTAGLMSSEEAYAEKRSTFTQWAHDQIAKGTFQTELKEVVVVDEVGTELTKHVPVITYDDNGLAKHNTSDFTMYGITVSGFQITDWDFEPKTLVQIAARREATMAIITAKANAERAKQDSLTAEEQGKANVMTAKYEREVLKKQAIVSAEQDKEVAIITAQKFVDVAAQQLLEAKQKRLAASEYKKMKVLQGEGDGEYKRLVMQADGALTQKLATYEAVMARFAEAVEKQKWVPEIQMGATSANGGGSTATALIDMLSVKTAKDLALDNKVN